MVSKLKRVGALFMSAVAAACFCACSAPDEGPDETPEEEPEEIVDDYKDWGEDYDYFYYEEYFHTEGRSDFKSSRGVNLYEAESSRGKFSDNESEYQGHYAKKSYHGDRSNSWIVEYFGSGEWIAFDIDSREACTVLVVLSIATDAPEAFAGAEASSLMTVKVNEEEDGSGEPTGGGTTVDSSDCYVESSGNWWTYEEIYLGEAHLIAGKNTIRLYARSSFNIDYMALAPKVSEVRREQIKYTGGELTVRCAEANGKLSSCRITESEAAGHDILGYTTDATMAQFIITADKDYNYVELRLSACFWQTGHDNASDADDNDEWLYNRIACTVNRRDVDVDPGFFPETDDEGNVIAEFSRKRVPLTGTHDPENWYNYESYAEVVLCNIDLKAGDNVLVISSAGYDRFNLDYIVIAAA